MNSYVQKQRDNLQWLLPKIKLYYILFGNTPSKNLSYIETSMIESSQAISFTNQLTGFYTTQASTERYLQADYFGTCQGVKNKIISQIKIVLRTPSKIPDSAFSKKQSMD